GLEKFLFTIFGQAIAWFEEYAFLQGNRRPDSVGVYKSLRPYATWICGSGLFLLPSAVFQGCLACWLPNGSHVRSRRLPHPWIPNRPALLWEQRRPGNGNGPQGWSLPAAVGWTPLTAPTPPWSRGRTTPAPPRATSGLRRLRNAGPGRRP